MTFVGLFTDVCSVPSNPYSMFSVIVKCLGDWDISHPNHASLLATPTVATGNLPILSPALTPSCPWRPPFLPLADSHFFIQTPQEADVLSQSLQLAIQLHLAQENVVHILGTRRQSSVSLTSSLWTLLWLRSTVHILPNTHPQPSLGPCSFPLQPCPALLSLSPDTD